METTVLGYKVAVTLGKGFPTGREKGGSDKIWKWMPLFSSNLGLLFP